MHAAELLSQRAHLTPDREALLYLSTGQRFTYAELNQRANRAANALAALGDDKSEMLPELDEGTRLDLQTPPGVATEQKFTQPPPRYNEGSLVRELERRGIGRPSTYASIISVIQDSAETALNSSTDVVYSWAADKARGLDG